MNQNEGTEPKELESDKMLAQINAAKAWKTPSASDVNEPVNSKPEEPEPTQPEKASKPTVEQEAAPQGKAESTETPDDKKSGKAEVDIREWAKRKGFKEGDQESVLRAYREMERKLSQVNAERKTEGNVPRGTPEPPAYVPTPNFARSRAMRLKCRRKVGNHHHPST